MKSFLSIFLTVSLFGFVSCQKQETEAERNAEIERQVQARIAAEKQSQEQKDLTARVATLEERQQEAPQAQPENDSTSQRDDSAVEQRSSSVSRRDRQPAGDDEEDSYGMFYRKLEPYGVWRETSTYGYVWQPREAQSGGWRPYTNGRWVYTDAGWTWVSVERFGWATYHYGRWTQLRGIGWVWIPGEEWAPAWVSWRTSNDYVGWAPLPPEARFDRGSGIHNWADNYYDIGPEHYCFVPADRLGEQRVETVVVPAQQNVTIVNQTINVTNITYNNKMVVNQGPNYDQLRSRSRQPIERLRLDRQVNVNVNVGELHPEVRGDVLQVPAPTIRRATAARPPVVKETVRETVVERGWGGINNRQEMEKVRTKLRGEATPPPNAPSKTIEKAVATNAVPAAQTSATPSSMSTASATPAPMHPGSKPAASETPVVSRPTATATATATSTPTAAATPTAPAVTPLPTRPETLYRESPIPRPTGAESEASRLRRERFQERGRQMQNRVITPTPRGNVPMEESSVSPTPRVRATPSHPQPLTPEASPSPSPESSPNDEKLSKQERREQRREERRDRRRGTTETPTPTPAAQ